MSEFIIEYTVERGARRRVRFDPRPGIESYWRIEERHNGCQWVVVGREAVSRVVTNCLEAQR